MGQLYVFEPWPTAVDTMGLCGPLVSTSAKYSASGNGEMELIIDHPIDQWDKWACLEPGNLIRADVPMRTTPLIESGSWTYKSDPTKYIVKESATRAERSVMSAPPYYRDGVVPTPIRLGVLSAGEIVYVTKTAFSWSAIVWGGGRGWILTTSLESAGTTTLSSARDATEIALPSPRTRSQLFRIYKVQLSDKGVQASARHVSYDIMGALTTYAPTAATCNIALSNVFLGTWWGAVPGHVWVDYYGNITEPTIDLAGWARAGQIEAMIAPSNSIAAYWNAAVLRDNWTYTFISDPEYASGYVIEYGKNLRGVTCETDVSDVQSALIPVGQTSKGKPLIIPDGTYTVDGIATTVYAGVVQSANDTHPVPHVGVLDLGASVKATGTSSSALNAAYTKMIRAARKKFADEKCDLPPVTLGVNFLNLGDTAEYAQYRDLQKLFLYDTVRVKHPRLGIDVTTHVNKIEWDCLLDRYNSIELGSVRKNYARTRVASWQVPGLETLSAYVDTISSAI